MCSNDVAFCQITLTTCQYYKPWRDSLQAAGNRDYCAVATQGVSKRNPCWPGWGPAAGRDQCVYACHRALESSGDRRLRADRGTDRRFRF